MSLSFFNNPFLLVGRIIAFLVAITVHELAHGYVADYLGDPTPRLAKRLTLNPFAHLDIMGTLLLLVAGFGWAKPVPIDYYNLRNPKRDIMLISFAGPAANLLTAILFAILLRFTGPFISSIGITFLELIIILNVGLAIFNLIPIHPLDGFKIVEGLLPDNLAHQWASLQSLGYIMLLILVFPIFGSSPVLSLIEPVINFILNFLIPSTPGM